MGALCKNFITGIMTRAVYCRFESLGKTRVATPRISQAAQRRGECDDGAGNKCYSIVLPTFNPTVTNSWH